MRCSSGAVVVHSPPTLSPASSIAGPLFPIAAVDGHVTPSSLLPPQLSTAAAAGGGSFVAGGLAGVRAAAFMPLENDLRGTDVSKKKLDPHEIPSLFLCMWLNFSFGKKKHSGKKIDHFLLELFFWRKGGKKVANFPLLSPPFFHFSSECQKLFRGPT